jgi:hypothetical protein
MNMKVCVLVPFSLFLASILPCAAQARWPQPLPLEADIFYPDGRTAALKVIIFVASGRPGYVIACHTLAFAETDLDFSYSGDFECRLNSTERAADFGVSTLLTDNPRPTRDWESRGRFLLDEVIDACGDYPEYGRLRHFKLRGMQIGLEVSDLDPVEHPRDGVSKFKSFRFKVQVTPDATATSSIAERPAYLDPLQPTSAGASLAVCRCDEVKRRR